MYDYYYFIRANRISDRISCHLFDTTAKNRQIDSVTVIPQTWMSKRRIYIHEYPFFYSKRVVFGNKKVRTNLDKFEKREAISTTFLQPVFRK